MASFGSELLAAALAGTATDERPLRHVAELPPRSGRPHDWPAWAEPDVVKAFADRGIAAPWSHQFAAAELAYAGRHVVVSTGTASGKSLAYQLPVLNVLATDPRARVLYLSPTKALGHDQLRAAHALTAAIPRLHEPGFAVAPTAYDGDSPAEVRRFARERSRWLFSNPDMIHLSILRNHARWAVLLRGLRFVVVDECHYYRGVFGSNVAMVLRRLLRLCARYSSVPTVIFASATTDSPGATATELIGLPVQEVTKDGSPQGARTVALWEPALRTDLVGENGAPVRRSAGAEAARVMADLIAEGAQTLTFVRSRRAAELTALGAQARLDDIAPELSRTVASYRAGYLAEDRTALERALAEGRLRGLATTNALELGVDIAGLDAVVLAGFPGTVASFWQQAGRSGRRGQGALVVLIARDDPLDTYLVHNPAALLDKPVERVVIDPTNPYILGPQLLCAATELPLGEAEVRELGATDVADGLVDDGLLRRRSGKYFPAPGLEPHAAVDIRGSTGGQIVIIEADTGRLLGSTDVGRAPASVHPGAVYLHQGESYVVDSLDTEEGIAFVHAEDPGYATFARELTDIVVTGTGERLAFGPVTLGLVPVRVTHRVVGYLRRLLSGEVIDFIELDMPEHTLATTSVMYTITEDALLRKGIDGTRIPGSLHAAEHAAIGLLPLVASCDRGDIGGLSTAVGPGPDGLPSVFVYDGYPGGAGFAERGFRRARTWLAATAAAIEACECPRGCPSCVQSPKCGNGNDPLDKAGAVQVLRLVLAELPRESR
ncbi:MULTISPECIES: DEAD/DEAH box helicase [Mycobacterium]|uniref:ATP-dependent rna helicase, dead/deah box family protein n=1 Tax=Mycobacterium indicus pranii (strain DSM 45239 / MTCC 9506) TaxID=1232724 RepID=J9W906_MYCIP|nr:MULTISPECIES: DEAD/DEAH box helicase [Mycobacterium]AFS12568.1 ATP-dependent rna helicase, dead/deah box family protein [Mycobacterium intracellulare subsp. intracellulare MTCC 9506]WSE54287.1 DEAD/DEAH box helicase [Mycobacterium sp. 2-64]BCO50148.1 helicase [Mycobacterium paraintracellulare]BCO82256.1 helicase [Mycobacterium paraintracellulare]BCO87336.1 helicase [Mycobacterium paraintracellulare]